MSEVTQEGISNEAYGAYGIVMFLIITMGLSGNITTIITLLQPEHRTKSVTYLMLNLAVADIFICGLGYPVAVTYNLKDHHASMKDSRRCSWLAFANALSGIACIYTLTLMSISQYRGVCKIVVTSRQLNPCSSKRLAVNLFVIWAVSFALCSPPFFNWNRFVPIQSGISCHPDWLSQDPSDKAYIWFLVTGGFFVPLTLISVSYILTYRFMLRSAVGEIGDNANRRRMYMQRRIGKVITAAILAFVISWSPYCIVSLISNFRGSHVISPEVSLVPELMAKASVIYNPLVYCSVNASFRTTLIRLIGGSLNRILSVTERRNTVEMEITSSISVRRLRERYNRSKSDPACINAIDNKLVCLQDEGKRRSSSFEMRISNI